MTGLTKTEMDAKTFWTILGGRPVAVPVVATVGMHGFLALSVAHVSASPPSVVVSIGKSTGTLKPLKEAGVFSINYLPEGATETADIFGGRHHLKGAGRFAEGAWDRLVTGAPTFREAVLVIDCEVDMTADYHETVLVVGRIVGHRMNSAKRPLVFFGGTYTSI